jgi:hypothetical protein
LVQPNAAVAPSIRRDGGVIMARDLVIGLTEIAIDGK